MWSLTFDLPDDAVLRGVCDVSGQKPLKSKMASSSRTTYQSQRHFYSNSPEIRRPMIMDCGDGNTEQNSYLDRSVFHGFDSPNYQNHYQWRNPPSQTCDRPSVFNRLGSRPNIQNTNTWGKPDTCKVPEQTTRQLRATSHHDQKQILQATFEDLPTGTVVIELCSHPTASGRRVRSEYTNNQNGCQIKKSLGFNDGQLKGKEIDETRSCETSSHNKSRVQFGKTSPMNRPEEHGKEDSGWGVHHNRQKTVSGPSHQTLTKEEQQFEERVFQYLTLFVEKPWSREDIEWIRRMLSYKSTPVPPDPNVEGLAPGDLVYVEPIRWRSENGGANTQCGQNHFDHAHNAFNARSNLGQYCGDNTSSRQRRALSMNFDLDMESSIKETNPGAKRLSRKRKAIDEDSSHTNIAPPIKRARLI